MTADVLGKATLAEGRRRAHCLLRQTGEQTDSKFEGQIMSAATPEHIFQVGMGFWASKTLLSADESTFCATGQESLT